MPAISNDERNMRLTFHFVSTRPADISLCRPDFENRVPFVVVLQSPTERWAYGDQGMATLSLLECHRLIDGLSRVLQAMHEGKRFETFSFSNDEAYFELEVADALEPDCCVMAVWKNMGAMTGGRVNGFEEGHRFRCAYSGLKGFTEGLASQLDAIELLAAGGQAVAVETSEFSFEATRPLVSMPNVCAEFVIRGDEFDPAEITEALEIPPSTCWRKGEGRGNKPASYHQCAFWNVSTEYEESLDINDQLGKIVSLLDAKKAQLLALKGQYDLSFTFGVVVQIKYEQTPAIYLNPETIRLIAHLGADFDLDLYV